MSCATHTHILTHDCMLVLRIEQLPHHACIRVREECPPVDERNQRACMNENTSNNIVTHKKHSETPELSKHKKQDGERAAARAPALLLQKISGARRNLMCTDARFKITHQSCFGFAMTLTVSSAHQSVFSRFRSFCFTLLTDSQ